MPLLFVKYVLFYPVRLFDWIERKYELLTFHTAQTELHLLVVLFLILIPFIHEYALDALQAFNLLGIIQALEFNFCSILLALDYLDAVLELEQISNAEVFGRRLE